MSACFALFASIRPTSAACSTLLPLNDFFSASELAAASTNEADLRGGHGTKTERARAVGQAIAERAKAKGITAVVFDRGGYLYHGRVKALADGAREGGLEF